MRVYVWGWLFTGQQDAGHATRNQQAQLSVYGIPTAILAGSIGSDLKPDLAFSSSPKRQIAPANLASDSQVARAMQEARSMRNHQVHLSAYGAPTAILARSTGFGPITDLPFSSSPERQKTPA